MSPSPRYRRRARRQQPALLIDAMGTLVRLVPPVPRLRAQLFDRFGVGVSAADVGAALLAEIAFYRAHMADGRDADSLHALRLRCAAVLREALPADCGALGLGLEEILDALLDSLQFVAYDDARDALVAVRAQGVRVVAVTNWDVSVLEVLEQTGLAPSPHRSSSSRRCRWSAPGPPTRSTSATHPPRMSPARWRPE
jgi:FMN phosphatase YigB (HAD superfamily)